MRRRNVKNIDERIQNATNLLIQNPEKEKGNWQKIFNNNNPIYLEIGMGKGDFIIEHAKNFPEINFIGLEKYPSVIIQAYDKANKLNLPNLKLISYDADKILEIFKENEIDKIFLNFSDPWPKSRHAKRRLTNHNFLKKYQYILNNLGEIEFKTDNKDLFTYSIVEMNNYQMQFLDLSFDLHHDKEEYIIKTEYEKKFIAKGNNIYFLKAKFYGTRN